MTYLTHEKYNDGIAYNDVALALVSGIKFTKRIYPICIPSSPVVYQDHLKNNFVEILGFAIENESEFYCPIVFAIIETGAKKNLDWPKIVVKLEKIHNCYPIKLIFIGRFLVFLLEIWQQLDIFVYCAKKG